MQDTLRPIFSQEDQSRCLTGTKSERERLLAWVQTVLKDGELKVWVGS